MKHMDKIEVKPIAYVSNNRDEVKDDFWGGVVSTIEFVQEIPIEALQGIEEFSHVEVIFHFHLLDKNRIDYGPLHSRGNTDWPAVGLYATRKKRRPNFLGATIAELIKVEGRTLTVQNLDANNGTPVIDIKPVMKRHMPATEVKDPPWHEELMKDYWAK